MKKVLVALVCTLGAVACGERRQADDPSMITSTSVTTERTQQPVQTAPAKTDTTAVAQSGSGTSSTNNVHPVDGRDTTRPLRSNDGATYGSVDPNAADPKATPVVGGGAAPVNDNAGVANGTKNADNTKVNERDRPAGALTPMDQGGGNDRDITAAIRRSVVGDKALSFNAKNVKIITVGGKVTLRGPVKSDDEKAAIESKAKSTAGVSAVDNQLEVKK